MKMESLSAKLRKIAENKKPAKSQTMPLDDSLAETMGAKPEMPPAPAAPAKPKRISDIKAMYQKKFAQNG
jgi:hypothetical protein